MTGSEVVCQKITVLGATGSIGMSTLDVLARQPERFQPYALTAGSRWKELADLSLKHRPRYAVIADETCAEFLVDALAGSGIEVLAGAKALQHVASDSEVDTVMAAIVGAAGLLPALAAAKAGKRVLLANKEALVMSVLVRNACNQRIGCRSI